VPPDKRLEKKSPMALDCFYCFSIAVEGLKKTSRHPDTSIDNALFRSALASAFQRAGPPVERIEFHEPQFRKAGA
jgi:hypothetical protein